MRKRRNLQKDSCWIPNNQMGLLRGCSAAIRKCQLTSGGISGLACLQPSIAATAGR